MQTCIWMFIEQRVCVQFCCMSYISSNLPWYVCFVTLSLSVCVLCPLTVYYPGGPKTHDDPDGTHHITGADPRYIADVNRSHGMQKRQVGDIIRTPATPCELRCLEWQSASKIEFVQFYIRCGGITDIIVFLWVLCMNRFFYYTFSASM